ncbi:DgyrCDS13359 [Dimorphilus gyrociliatus]|uniref:DgyrCDS13359 n=1 Tax=Dimorphilus gyrociliatus TaxID=2664684 RepID=A0A7I8WAJ0_9ANNE|nr:DgyrCDS13359 [Dimorphilus gyrociliatus]
MTDAGFFKGTSADQDNRFSDKKKKLMKQMKFAANLEKKVDMVRVKLDTIKPWITDKVTEILGMEDDVVVGLTINQLEENRYPDAKDMQINLTGFLNARNARIFMSELWDLMLTAMESPNGIPEQFVEKKKIELLKRQEEEDKIRQSLKAKEEEISKVLLTNKGSVIKEENLPDLIPSDIKKSTSPEAAKSRSRSSSRNVDQDRLGLDAAAHVAVPHLEEDHAALAEAIRRKDGGDQEHQEGNFHLVLARVLVVLLRHPLPLVNLSERGDLNAFQDHLVEDSVLPGDLQEDRIVLHHRMHGDIHRDEEVPIGDFHREGKIDRHQEEEVQVLHVGDQNHQGAETKRPRSSSSEDEKPRRVEKLSPRRRGSPRTSLSESKKKKSISPDRRIITLEKKTDDDGDADGDAEKKKKKKKEKKEKKHKKKSKKKKRSSSPEEANPKKELVELEKVLREKALQSLIRKQEGKKTPTLYSSEESN